MPPFVPFPLHWTYKSYSSAPDRYQPTPHIPESHRRLIHPLEWQLEPAQASALASGSSTRPCEFVDAFGCHIDKKDVSQPEPLVSPTQSRSATKERGAGGEDYTRSRSKSILSLTSASEMSLSEDVSTGKATLISIPYPDKSPIQVKGARKTGLLRAPPGSVLEVNDLLILHPPSNSRPGFGTHNSQYEMYTCRVCSKTYDGKNARSVARRHLQDKHGVPLSAQARRSRWDASVANRPKDKKDAKERTLKAKREWANRNRQQIRVGKTNANVLQKLGPKEVVTGCGLRLIAPSFRDTVGEYVAGEEDAHHLDRESGKFVIPGEASEGAQIERKDEGSKEIGGGSVADLPEHKIAIHRGEKGGASNGLDEMASSRLGLPSGVSAPSGGLMSAIMANSSMSSSRLPLQTSYHPNCHAQHLDIRSHGRITPTCHLAESPMGGVLRQPNSQQQPDYSRIPDLIQTDLKHTMALLRDDKGIRPARPVRSSQDDDNAYIGAIECQRDDGEGSADAEIEDAAESLLNLHSTPARGLERDQDGTSIFRRVSPVSSPTSLPPPAWLLVSSASSKELLDEAVHTSAKSSIHSVNDSTRFPQGVKGTQSLPFDDPFSPGHTIPYSARLRAPMPSGSVSISSRGQEPQKNSLKTSPSRVCKASATSPFTPYHNNASRPALRPLTTNIGRCHIITATPVRSSITSHIPSSLTKGWLLSSPSNGDTAASLGLVPTHLAPTTPGMMSGVVGTDTPRYTRLFERQEEPKRDREKGASRAEPNR